MAGPKGPGYWAIWCEDLSYCWAQASGDCPGGYEVADGDESVTGAKVGAVGGQGWAVASVKRRKHIDMLIRCTSSPTPPATAIAPPRNALGKEVLGY